PRSRRGARAACLAGLLRQRLPAHARVLCGTRQGTDRFPMSDPHLARRFLSGRPARAVRPGPDAVGSDVLKQPATSWGAGGRWARAFGRGTDRPQWTAYPRFLLLTRAQRDTGAGCHDVAVPVAAVRLGIRGLISSSCVDLAGGESAAD